MPTVEEFRSRMERIKAKRPQETEVEVCLNPDLQRQYSDFVDTYGLELEKNAERRVELDALKARMAEETEKVALRSVGRVRYDGLLLAYPPTDQQIKEAVDKGQEPPDYDVEIFSVALVANCMVAAVLDPATAAEEEWQELLNEVYPQVTEWAEQWNSMEFLPLYLGAQGVNTLSHNRHLGKSYG